MVTRKEDTARRQSRRKYEEKNKEQRKETNSNFQTMIPRELYEEISSFLKEIGMTKVQFIKEEVSVFLINEAMNHEGMVSFRNALSKKKSYAKVKS